MTSPKARSHARHLVPGLVLVTVLAVLLGACTSPKDVLGSSSSPCFRAIAVAADAVHDSGRFDGVRYLSASSLDTALRHGESRGTEPAELAHNTAGVCVVAYRGDFSDVNKGWTIGPLPEHLALVVVSAHDNKLLATILVSKAPLPLARVLPLLR